MKILEKEKKIWGYSAIIDTEKYNLKRYLILIRRSTEPIDDAISKIIELTLQKKGKEQGHLLTEKTGINLAAVDFVFSFSLKDPDPLILEINYFFGRRGLGGTENYYRILYRAVQDWLIEVGLDPKSIRLV